MADIKHAHRKYLAAEMKKLLTETYFHDSVIICEDGSIPCNRLILGLLFPELKFDESQEEVTILRPGTFASEQSNDIKNILNHDKTCCISRNVIKTVTVNAVLTRDQNIKDEFEEEAFTAEVVLDPEEDVEMDDEVTKSHQADLFKKDLSREGSLAYNVVKQITSYPCGTPDCLQTFATKSQRSKHHFKVHFINYYCPFCTEEFDSDINLKVHKNTHLNVNCLAVGCTRKFFTEARRNLHQRREHPSLKSTKSVTKSLDNNKRLGYVCEVCGKEIVGGQNIKHHSVKCHKKLDNEEKIKNLKIDKGQTCPVCFLYFEGKINYKHHLETHDEIDTTPVRSHTCEHCGKSFESKGGLNVHLRTHSDYRPYKCDLCEMRFKHDCNRKTHQNTHTGTKLFDCEICGKSYAQHSSLKSHQRSAHLNQTYNCEHCGEAYKRKYNFRQHKKKCDGKNTAKKATNQFRRPLRPTKVHLKKHEKENEERDDIVSAFDDIVSGDEDMVKQIMVVENGQDFVCSTPDPVKFVVVPSNILNVVVAD